MKKIYCELANDDYAKISVEDGLVNLSVAQGDDVNVVVFSPDKIRKLRKQLKKALLQIEGVKDEAEDDWFSPGKKVVITQNDSSHQFPIGTVAIMRKNELNDDRSKHCEYLDGHDYWFIRRSDCKPYKEAEA